MWASGILLGKKVIRRLKQILRPSLMGTVRDRSEDFSLSVPFEMSVTLSNQSKPIGVICHLYNLDLAAEIHSYLCNVGPNTYLYISTDSEEKADAIQREFSNWNFGQVEIRIVTNRGRDIAPKYVAFREVYDRHDLILFVHSKKSAHLITAAEWRRSMLAALCGSTDIVASVLEIFRSCEDVGVVFPQQYSDIRPFVSWRNEFRQARGLAKRMGIKLSPSQVIDFPAGSMFWCRSSALRPILDLNLAIDDFPEERGQINGTIAHQLERLVLHVCEKAGYNWLKVSTEQFCDAPLTRVQIGSRQDLKNFITLHGIKILR